MTRDKYILVQKKPSNRFSISIMKSIISLQIYPPYSVWWVPKMRLINGYNTLNTMVMTSSTGESQFTFNRKCPFLTHFWGYFQPRSALLWSRTLNTSFVSEIGHIWGIPNRLVYVMQLQNSKSCMGFSEKKVIFGEKKTFLIEIFAWKMDSGDLTSRYPENSNYPSYHNPSSNSSRLLNSMSSTHLKRKRF